jgi:hypothetical protein
VEEVDLLPVDRRGELRVRVEPGLVRPPVIFGSPMLEELAHVVQRHAVAPAHGGQLVRPAHAGETRLQVVEIGLAYAGAKRSNG